MNRKFLYMNRKFLKCSIYIFTIIVMASAMLFTLNTKDATAVSYNTNLISLPTRDTSGKTIEESQTIYLSAADKMRANNGELTFDASLYVEANGSRTQTSYVRVTCYNDSTKLKTYEDGVDGKYSVGRHRRTFTLTGKQIPANTTHIVYDTYNHIGTKGDLVMKNYSLVIHDNLAPTYFATVPVTVPNKYKVGTVIRYQVQYSEPVVPTTYGNVKFKVGTQEFNTNTTYAGQNSDNTIVYYDFALPKTATLGDNLAVVVTGLNNMVVRDDAYNYTTTTKSFTQNNGFYVDNKPPEVTGITTTASTNAVYKEGEVLRFDVTFHENIWVNGAPKINLSNGKSANYIRQTTTDTNEASFFYTISKDDDIKNLSITSVDFSDIYDSVSNYATASPSYSANAFNSFLNDKNVSIDTTAPTTEFTAAPDGWQSAYDVFITPTDNISGVKEIYSAWTAVDGTPSFPVASNVDTVTCKIPLPKSSGIYQLHVKLKDNVNNEGTQKSPYTYYFDLDAPSISVNVSKTEGTIEGTDLVSSITASSSDAHSGVKTFTYVWKDADNITALTGNANEGILIPTKDGIYTLTITATDNVGNSSTKTIENLAVDSIAPQVEFISRGGEAYQKSYMADFTVTDEKSGVASYYYIWSTSAEKPDADSNEWKPTTETKLTTPSGLSGTYYLHIKAIDKVNNMGISSSDGFNIDNAAPNVTITPNGNEGNIGKASYDVVISINDEISMYDKLSKKYVISESETCPEDLFELTGNSVTIKNLDKTMYLYIVVSDEAGNETVYKSKPFIADITPPAGSISKEVDIYYTNTNNVTINIEAEDDYSDDIYMQIRIDGIENDWEDFAGQKTVSFNTIESEHTIDVRFRDVYGNISEYKSVKYHYDITPPEIQFEYSTSDLTNSPVIVTATAIDKASSVTFETINKVTFNENGSFEFVAVDEAGNRARKAAIVNNIDKTNPQITFSSKQFDGKKHKSAEVTINASDSNGIRELKYAVVKSGEPVDSYTSCENGKTVEITNEIAKTDGTYTVIAVAVDNAGNSVTVTSQNIYIDNIAPIANISYSPAARTAQNVIATITFNEDVIITNNEGSNTRTFNDNGSFTFEFADEAGNTGTAVATVTWIDRTLAETSVILKNDNGEILDSEQWTNKDVIAEISIPDNCSFDELKFNNVQVADSTYVIDLGGNKYKISSYGRLSYTVIDNETGTITSGEEIIRIDKTPPSITDIKYSTDNWTNGNVTVVITAVDDYNNVVYVNGNSYIFTENGEHEFVIEDSLGNRTLKRVPVTNIDKEVPIPEITYNNMQLTNESVTATISFNEGGSPVRVTNNNGQNTYVFAENGEFTFEFSDEAGNTGSITATVNNIDKIPPEISLMSDEFDLKPHKSVSVTITADDLNGINEIKYRFVNESRGTVPQESEGTVPQNCENGETVTLDSNSVDGRYVLEVTAYDNVGNAKTVTSDNLILDNTSPIASISYAPSARTAQNVVASISFNEEAIILNNSGSNEYVFTDNGEFTFEFSDIAGNTATKTAYVDWIDRNQPVATVSLSNEGWTTEDVTVTLTPQEGASIQNVRFNNNEIQETAENQYLITDYGTLTYEVMDETTGIAGTGEVLIRIDRTAPVITDVTYSTRNWTNRNVVVSITATDNLSTVSYENGNSYTFTENGSHEFIVTDSAGTSTTKTVEVDWIDKEVPVASITYNITELTNQNVIATVSFNEGGSPVSITNNHGSRTYEFTVNGRFTFEFTDAAGNSGTAEANVSNIDKVLPEISFTSEYFDASRYKSADVTINATDLNSIKSLKYKFVKAGETGGELKEIQNGDTVSIADVSGTYQVIAVVEDAAGNIKTATSQSINLDNSAPAATVSYTPNTRTAQNVVANITFDEKTTITNNGGSASYTFTENGSFTFEFTDDLGNKGTYIASVNWIDRTVPSSRVVVTNSEGEGDVVGEEWTNKNVIVSIIPSPFAAVEDVRFDGIPVRDTELITDRGNNEYMVSGYGKLTYTLRDIDTNLTNTGEVMIRVDKTPPSITGVNYSTEEWTNENVSVTITTKDDLGTVTYPNGSSHIFTQNGSYEFIVEDNAGNRTSKTVTVDWIDKEIPIPTVNYYVDNEKYDTSIPTNKNVVAKVTFENGDGSPASGSPVFITNNSGKAEYEFSSNGSFTFLFADAAGNEGSVAVSVSKIDKVAPTAYITYSYTGWTNKDVTATLVATDDINEVIIMNNPSDTYTFEENGSFTFEFMDSAGNIATAKAEVTKIDKKPPELSYQLSTEEVTPLSVYAFVSADEPVTIINNDGKTTRQFNSNGEFTFIVRDRAGNESEITATVSNISKETTPVKLLYSNTEATNEDVYVTIVPEDGTSYIYVTNNNGQKTRKFTENGEFTFTYKNAAGIEGEAVASVSNIDKTPPIVDVTYSHTEITKDNVTVTFTADKEVIYPYIIVDNKYTFNGNMKLQIPVTDKVGNVTNVIIETNLIDKTPPSIKIEKEYEVLKIGDPFNVRADITVTDDTSLDGDLGISGEYNTSKAGDYVITYTATDKAGNVTVVHKYLTVYDPNKFNVIINGRMAIAGQVNADTKEIDIKAINSTGNIKVKRLMNKKSIGDFKTQGEEIELKSEFPGEGYYTLYITDDERNSCLVYVYIAE